MEYLLFLQIFDIQHNTGSFASLTKDAPIISSDDRVNQQGTKDEFEQDEQTEMSPMHKI